MEAHLVVEQGPSRGTHILRPGETRVLGRGPGADIKLRDPALAPRHVAVSLGEDGLSVTDLGGPGGARLDDAALAPQVATPAAPGSELTLGAHLVRLVLHGAPRLAARAAAAAAVQAAVPSLPAGFTPVRFVGEGSSGTVWSARWKDGDDERQVALKLLKDEVPPGAARERFMREALATMRVRSPHVVQVLDAGADRSGRPWIAMEWVDGPSARDLARRGPLPVGAALCLGVDVARALAAAAAAAVVHRDVKPANILVTRDGVAKLTDFGLAKDLEATLLSLTSSGQGLGTLSYVAPEQLHDAKRVDARADLYALGATLFHLLTGRPPHAAASPEELVRSLKAPLPPIGGLRPDCPPDVAQGVQALLVQDPAARPAAPQAVELLAALRARHGAPDALARVVAS